MDRLATLRIPLLPHPANPVAVPAAVGDVVSILCGNAFAIFDTPAVFRLAPIPTEALGCGRWLHLFCFHHILFRLKIDFKRKTREAEKTPIRRLFFILHLKELG